MLEKFFEHTNSVGRLTSFIIKPDLIIETEDEFQSFIS